MLPERINNLKNHKEFKIFFKRLKVLKKRFTLLTNSWNGTAMIFLTIARSDVKHLVRVWMFWTNNLNLDIITLNL